MGRRRRKDERFFLFLKEKTVYYGRGLECERACDVSLSLGSPAWRCIRCLHDPSEHAKLLSGRPSRDSKSSEGKAGINHGKAAALFIPEACNEQALAQLISGDRQPIW